MKFYQSSALIFMCWKNADNTEAINITLAIFFWKEAGIHQCRTHTKW
jgi:hypothetical protein